ncbi:NACHT domain-containing protein [Pedobacter sp.]
MEITSLIATVVTTQLKGLLTKISKEFGVEVEHIINNNILEYQVEEYNRNLYSKTLLHRVQPKKLTEFYQPLFISKCDPKYRHRRIGFGVDEEIRIPTNSIKELFSDKQYITLIGSAGSGKSTIIKHLFLNAIDTHFKIPIKIELRYLNEYDGSIIEYIKENIFKLSKLASNDRIIERLMKSGDFVFFLDGYDEISSNKKERITKQIDDLVKLYNKNCYVLTTRPYTEIEMLPLFHNFEVCELSDDDINQFIRKQIPATEAELIDKIIEAINNPENRSYKSFLSNPLLLSMFILTFQSYSSIPQKRSVFYSQVFDALFSVHDSMSKLAFVREKQSGLSKEQIIEVMELFSFLSYFEEKFIFTSNYLNSKLDSIKEKKVNIKFDNQKLISDLQIAIGIINQDGTEYTFPHRSLQEYFTALYISSLSDPNKEIVYKKIVASLTNDRGYRINSKDNFHLILSELDEEGVIKFAIIPFLENYKRKLQLSKMVYKTIIDRFVQLETFYSSFYPILKEGELMRQNNLYSEKFREYHPKKNEEKIGTKEWEEQNEKAREKLANKDIKPFLENYKEKIEEKIFELKSYLDQQNKSDNDIISLI